MAPLLWRIIYAVIVVAFVWAILAPLLRFLGLPMSGDLQAIVRAIVGFGALLYIVFGWSFPR